MKTKKTIFLSDTKSKKVPSKIPTISKQGGIPIT